MSIFARFDAAYRLTDDEVPEQIDYGTVQQALQDALGFSGVLVIDVTEYEAAPPSPEQERNSE